MLNTTTVVGSWTNVDNNMTETSRRYNRIINNISLAMPHNRILSAAKNPKNNILQPENLDVSLNLDRDDTLIQIYHNSGHR